MNNNTAFAVIAIVSALALFGVVAAVTVASITLQQKQKQEGAERVRRSTLHRDDASEDRIEQRLLLVPYFFITENSTRNYNYPFHGMIQQNRLFCFFQ